MLEDPTPISNDTPSPNQIGADLKITATQICLLIAILMLALFLRSWNIAKEGFGNPYYYAAVRSMLESPSNFFFGSFDTLGIVTVDKPPVALWIQGFSAWLFGFCTNSVMLPQALLGVFNVYLTFVVVKKGFSARSALIAAFTMAIMPIAVAMDRVNMPDTFLLTTTLISACYLLNSCQSGSLADLLVSLAFLGLGFNTKMLAAWVVLPAWFIVWWKSAPLNRTQKTRQTLLGGLVLVLTSLAWAIAFDLTPASRRPYAGGSSNNSMLQLSVGYNGVSRIVGGLGGGPGGRPPGGPPDSGPGRDEASKKEFQSKAERKDAQTKGRGFGGPGGPPGMGRGGPMAFFHGGPIGPWRLIWPSMAGLAFWLCPFAFLGMPRWSTIKQPKLEQSEPVHALLAGWFVMWALVLCLSSGIMHPYYSIMIAPPIAALAAIAFDRILKEGFPQGRRGKWFIAFALIWQGVSLAYSSYWRLWLIPSIGLLIGLTHYFGLRSELHSKKRQTLLKLTVAGFFIAPFLWSLTPTFGHYAAFMPAADPSFIYNKNAALAGPPGASISFDNRQRLFIYLKKHKPGSKILLAMSSAFEASPFIINFADSIVSMGGFHGSDPIFSESDIEAMVKSGELKYAMIMPRPAGGPGGRGGPGGSPPGNRALAKIIETYGTPVDSKVWFIADPKPNAIPDDIPDFMQETTSQSPTLYSLGDKPVAKNPVETKPVNPSQPKP